MAYSGPGSNGAELGGFRSEARESGGRRKKLAGYLKAANELRQTYFSADHREGTIYGEEDGFPHAAVVRSGNEEMILFPSYAKAHVKRQSGYPPSTGRDLTEEEYWRNEWIKHEDSNSVVDVDVRGWIYTPQRGQITRKQRLMIGVAKQMSGLPLSSTGRSGDSGSSSNVPSRSSSPTRAQEEELINLEAEKIVRTGEREERYANRGAFSEKPGAPRQNDGSGAINDEVVPPNTIRHRASYASTISSQDDEVLSSHRRRSSWQQPAHMTAAELETANKHLFTRLRPFMANAIVDTTIKVFFYNDVASREHSIQTDGSGHFNYRAALDFIPTHVRILAGERLSVTEQVIVTSPKGVSLISDIDDTVKHSAVTAGPREIFRTAFIRELGDLTIEGVREWYTQMSEMGVKLHYVSNSPWQMYPILTTYFKLAHLPKGSFHLKAYTGMFQGIFEPVAERKKSSLDRLMRDFPNRKFILVGDSGEADLEVYTEVALGNPGKILGIFIRDVTTTPKTGYFDPNYGSTVGSGPRSRNASRQRSGDSLAMSKKLTRPDDIRNDEADLEAAIAASLKDMEEEARSARRSINPDAPAFERFNSRMTDTSDKPRLPPRPPATSRSQDLSASMTASPDGDLIEFLDQTSRPRLSQSSQSPALNGRNAAQSPTPPPKPTNLRNNLPELEHQVSPGDSSKPRPPPIPRKPPGSAPRTQTNNPNTLPTIPQREPLTKAPPPLPARRRLSSNGESLPFRPPENSTKLLHPTSLQMQTNQQQPSSPLARPLKPTTFDDFNLPPGSLPKPPPPPPPRRSLASSSSSTTTTTSTGPRNEGRPGSLVGGGSGGWDDPRAETASLASGGGGEYLSKKESLWQQRWERARDMLERKGVTLRTWRVGTDVAGVCVKLVEMELRRVEREEGK